MHDMSEITNRGGATMGHKGATAPLTFYKHAYVDKHKLKVEKSHEWEGSYRKI